jgi:hypothetical protein
MSKPIQPDAIIPYDELLRMFLNLAEARNKADDKVNEQETRIQNLLLQLHLARNEIERLKNG